MNYSFEYIDIILLAMIAGFIFLRLRGILGKKTGHEENISATFAQDFSPKKEEFKEDILVPDLKLGDAVLFNFKTVHGSTGNQSSQSRRAFSMRFIGDDVTFTERGGPTSPPFDEINLKSGDRMREDWFPKVFSN